ncbi:hypothetical protein ARALYDRAFT_908998 [Arabidopsis lyrata subsp. lyrata]|uniref:Uncharacterized protein n=1 Tax=Arabidopsis lyrata subsp. lyrata TaxID=81972 RepID=D7M2X0_ARALL|nr:hypothetical protein ARALYDRAFT_908998 [Arabidopsis lyrata subsp. lyrata]
MFPPPLHQHQKVPPLAQAVLQDLQMPPLPQAPLSPTRLSSPEPHSPLLCDCNFRWGEKKKKKSAGVSLAVHILVCWFFVYGYKLGIIGTIASVNVPWWLNIFILFMYSTRGGCTLTWTGFSTEAFTGLLEFTKLSASSGIMLCLENWYYKILILMTGNLVNAKVAVDSLSICMSVNGWEMMIPLALFAGTGYKIRIRLLISLQLRMNGMLYIYLISPSKIIRWPKGCKLFHQNYF